jgi:hypothetical protein
MDFHFSSLSATKKVRGPKVDRSTRLARAVKSRLRPFTATVSEPLCRVVYASTAAKPFSEQQLETHLKSYRERNGKRGITGMLLYKDGNFMQCLEGPKTVVSALLAKIQSDPRHRDVNVLLCEENVEREFSEWTMGFKKLGRNTAREIPGYSDFFDLSLTSGQFQLNPSKSLQLLLCFRNVMRYPRRD